MSPAEWLRRRGSKCLLSAPQPLREIFSSPRGKWLNPLPPTHFPSPTSTTLCHRARGCAGRCTTPGSGRSAFPTPQGVVPFVPAKGFDIKGRIGMGFTGAEEESARNVCPLSTQYTHITCHPFEPSAQPRWGCLCLWPLPGVAPPRRNPGSRPHRVPYPARGCAVRARRGVRYQRAEWDGDPWCR